MEDKTEELERSSSENVTIVAETYARAPTATVSSLKSQDSTEQLICKSPPSKPKAKKESVRSKSVEASVGSGVKRGARRGVVLLGLAQVAAGALLAAAGAAAVLKGAALARVGAGLWAGCVAVVAGVVGVLAGINDCYGLNGGDGSSPLLSGFLALSLLALACGNSAAVLAGTGLQRDYTRAPRPALSFQDEMDAWTPVLANIAVLIIACVHCLLSLLTICHLSKRVCPCFRRKQPYDHNQFTPGGKIPGPVVLHVNERDRKRVPLPPAAERARSHELCRELEARLQPEEQPKKEEQQFDSATSRTKLVSSWLGRQAPSATAAPAAAGVGVASGARGARGRVRKPRPPPPPVVLLPAHPASTLGRVPVSVMMPPRYATLPLPPYAPPPPPGALYYPVHDPRFRRRRSPRGYGGGGGGGGRAERRRRGSNRERERDSQLTRSLERIHRKRRAERERERVSDAELKRTYTGLDRAYAEQFIAVCDESRSHAADHSDSLASTASSDLAHPAHPSPSAQDKF